MYNSSGTRIGSYTYDAWGNCTVSLESSATTAEKRIVRNFNPFRYRGYYYDYDTGLYYLQSRYYVPQWGRFLNADGYVSTGTGLLGYNMYTYCNNNPVMYLDPTGEIAITTIILITACVVGGVVALYTGYVEYQKGSSTVEIIFNSVAMGLGAFCTVYSLGMYAYDFYLNCCSYYGWSPVTDISISKNSSSTPYAHLQDPPDVAPGKEFTAKQKATIIAENKSRNGGVVRSDLSGQELIKPAKSQKGVTPSPYEYQIDHIVPKSKGGTNSYSNAQVLSREENRIKWDK